MSTMSNDVSFESGNTSSQTSRTKKRISASKYWCFTFNNYELDDLSNCLKVFKQSCPAGIVGKEVGENGTPHLQGYIECKKPVRPLEFFNLSNSIHWEKKAKKSTRDDNFIYCSKDKDFVHWGYIFKDDYCGEDLYMVDDDPNDFQKKVKDIINLPNNDRRIDVFIGDGNDGKTKMCKWLVYHKQATLLGGKTADCAYAINGSPKMVVWNIPKEGSINLQAIEMVKDGLIFSPKYESGTKIFNPPKVLIFCNKWLDCDGKISLEKEEWNDLNSRIIFHDMRGSTPTPPDIPSDGGI